MPCKRCSLENVLFLQEVCPCNENVSSLNDDYAVTVPILVGWGWDFPELVVYPSRIFWWVHARVLASLRPTTNWFLLREWRPCFTRVELVSFSDVHSTACWAPNIIVCPFREEWKWRLEKRQSIWINVNGSLVFPCAPSSKTWLLWYYLYLDARTLKNKECFELIMIDLNDLSGSD